MGRLANLEFHGSARWRVWLARLRVRTVGQHSRLGGRGTRECVSRAQTWNWAQGPSSLSPDWFLYLTPRAAGETGLTITSFCFFFIKLSTHSIIGPAVLPKVCPVSSLICFQKKCKGGVIVSNFQLRQLYRRRFSEGTVWAPWSDRRVWRI